MKQETEIIMKLLGTENVAQNLVLFYVLSPGFNPWQPIPPKI